MVPATAAAAAAAGVQSRPGKELARRRPPVAAERGARAVTAA
jgi:hypothetical protein